ncbi:MAG: hypothetical protein ACYDAD_15795 [Acidimicrobiales bacterium]
MLQRQLADLPVDPRPVDRDRLLVRPERRYDRCEGDVVEHDASDLCQHRRLPGRVAEAGLTAPGLARVGVVLAVAAIGERSVVPQLATAHAFKEAAQQVDTIPVLRSSTAGLGTSDSLHPRPELVGDGRRCPPWCRSARLVRAAVPPDPAVVERVHEDHPDACPGEPRLGLELHRAYVAQRVPLEQAHNDGHVVGVDLEGVRRLRKAPEAQRGVAAGVALLVELRGVALGNALREAAAVLLRPGRLGDQLVPVRGIGAQDLPVAHHQADTVRVQLVLE